MTIATRRSSREAALQFLYQEDFVHANDLTNCQEDLEDRFLLFCSQFQVNKKGRDYALQLIRGVCRDLAQVDRFIEQGATNWRLSRIAATDRNLLRIAVWEMLHQVDVPPQVAINEALEIAKRFSGDDAPKFINGVLDAVRQQLDQRCLRD
jgi:N utilization substance protein B